MKRRQIDEYLDGMMGPEQKAAVETALAADASAAALLAQMQAERQVRTAAYDSYAPTADETASFITQFRAAAEAEELAPVAKIGPRHWVRWTTGIAAGLALLIGTFAAGRMTATQNNGTDVAAKEVVRTEYSVVTIDTLGETQVHTFASLNERQSFITDYLSRGAGTIAVADLGADGHM